MLFGPVNEGTAFLAYDDGETTAVGSGGVEAFGDVVA